MKIDDPEAFHYRPECHAGGCRSEARYKLAAPWTNGTSHELKNYGISCDEHLPRLLARARASRAGLVLSEGEYVGEIAVYPLQAGRRDAELSPIPGPTISPRDP
ncbi:MAG: hypothetical protein U0800_16715 [Isosphaeraceae bacterium]